MRFQAIVSSLARRAAPLLVAAALGTGAGGSQAQTRTGRGADEAIMEMNTAYKKGDRKRLAALLPQARGHLLEPWAAYWELRLRLGDAPGSEIQDFLTRWTGTYVEDRLRNDWLLLLGQRRDWAGFAAEYPHYRMGDDRELRCYALALDHLNLGDLTPPTLAEEVRKNWYALKDADDGCTLAADRLLEARLLQPADIWRKARLAAQSNRPRMLRAAVEIVAPQALPDVNDVMAHPARYLAAHSTAPGQTRKQLLVLALTRLAASDPGKAASVLDNKWGVHLSAEDRNWAWGVIGRQAAMSLDTQALRHFAHVGALGDLGDEQLGWLVRATLRSANPIQGADWRRVVSAIDAMSAEGRRDPAWTYWKARALLALAPTQRSEAAAAGAAQARALLEGLAGVRGFYEQLALEELDQRIGVPPRPAPLTSAEKEGAERNPGLVRALAAIRLGLRPEGVREWNYHTNLVNTRGQSGGMGERELLAAAQLACEHEVWDRCINTSERTRTEIDFEQRFPMPHRDAVLRRSRELGLDPAFVYGLIRQESRFVTDARSHVGAAGLMQVMPATARWTAKKIGLTAFTPGQLGDRETNIAIGTGYLKLVLDDFEGSMALAAAAYNAGPGRPRQWRAPGGAGPVLETAIWAENVPFSETRDYVKKVLANTTSYAALISGQPQSLKTRLGSVGPRTAGQTAEDKDLP